jgi:uncharacterized protein (UPF0212 family)
MQALTASELLDAWEHGLTQPPVQRALTLLAAACPESSVEELAQLSIGQRDARLLWLREWTFGPHITSLAICPVCGERLELNFNVDELCIASVTETSEAIRLEVDGYDAKVRLPNSFDLAAVAESTDIAMSRRVLLERCLLSARQEAEEMALEQLPAKVLNAIVEQMASKDPQADVNLNLSCPQCGHQWQMVFDIASFFWSEINAWAYRLLREVNALARAYGWPEQDILALSPWRRQLYLEMIGG